MQSHRVAILSLKLIRDFQPLSFCSPQVLAAILQSLTFCRGFCSIWSKSSLEAFDFLSAPSKHPLNWIPDKCLASRYHSFLMVADFSIIEALDKVTCRKWITINIQQLGRGTHHSLASPHRWWLRWRRWLSPGCDKQSSGYCCTRIIRCGRVWKHPDSTPLAAWIAVAHM